jgi:hypothetical protein
MINDERAARLRRKLQGIALLGNQSRRERNEAR